eukprot:SAG11_NODE_10614_length_817_cov_0.770195_1_plen_99_part_00
MPLWVMLDCKGSLGGLSQQGSLYSAAAAQAGGAETWGGNTQRIVRDPIPSSRFLTPDGVTGDAGPAAAVEEAALPFGHEDVEYWSDFLKVCQRTHSRL